MVTVNVSDKVRSVLLANIKISNVLANTQIHQSDVNSFV